MFKNKTKRILSRIAVPRPKLLSWLAVVAIVVAALPLHSTQAAQLTPRKLTLGSSAPGNAANSAGITTYTFNFTTATASVIQSFQAQVCTTATGTCTTPTGLVTTSSTLNSVSGFPGTWTVNNATAGTLRATTSTATSTAAGTGVTIQFGTVTNPTTPNQTFYVRLTDYSDTAWTTSIDSGITAASTAAQITVQAHVDEMLVFCVYTGASCGDGGSTVDLGTLSTATTGSGTSKMDAGTNAGTGYVITYTGNTLTSGSNTIPACSTGCSPAVNTGQYGLNLMANTVSTATPTSLGADITPASNGTNYRGQVLAGYSTGGASPSFKYATGDSIANSGNATLGPTDSQTYTVSYIANITASQAAGDYVSTVTYIATATF